MLRRSLALDSTVAHKQCPLEALKKTESDRVSMLCKHKRRPVRADRVSPSPTRSQIHLLSVSALASLIPVTLLVRSINIHQQRITKPIIPLITSRTRHCSCFYLTFHSPTVNIITMGSLIEILHSPSHPIVFPSS